MRNHWWWRPGWSEGRRVYTFHVTFRDADATVDGGADLRRLAAEHQARLAAAPPGLDPVPLEWLHLTMQNVGFADEVGEERLRQVAATATAACAALAPFELTFAGAIVSREAVMLLPAPPDPVAHLREALRGAIGAVLGVEAVTTSPEQVRGFRPHVSVAYANADGPAQAYEEAVAAAPALAPASVRVRAATLMSQDRDEGYYRWRTLWTIPLAGGA
jgi:2'-5' RNA ligase